MTMDKNIADLVNKNLFVLIGQPLCSINRGGGSIFINFGKLIGKNSAYFTEDGKAAVRKTLAGRYALHIESSSRLICGDEIIFAKRDMFLPNSQIESQENFDWNTFEWDTKGCNLFDEKIKNLLEDKDSNFVVSKVRVNLFGDLKIHFENGFSLEVFNDISGFEECWRFFEINSDIHFVVSSQGLEGADEDLE